MKLSVTADHLLEGGVLIGGHLARELGAGAIPLLQPLRREQLMPTGRRHATRRGRERDGGFQFFSRISPPGDVKAGSEKRRAVRGGTGVGEELGRPTRASF